MAFLRFVAACVLGFLAWTNADAAGVRRELRFDHANPTTAGIKRITINPGDTFQVLLEHTCPAEFNISVAESQSPHDVPSLKLAACMPGTLTSGEIAPNESATYIVDVARNGGTDPATSADGSKLAPIKFRVEVTVTEKGWVTMLSGGFTTSTVTNQKYALTPTSTPGTFNVHRAKSGEDDVALGIAAFVTVYNQTLSPLAPGVTFGFGTDNGSKLSYFIGPAWQLGDLSLAIGAHIGQVDTLPSGLKTGDTTTDANALANLGSKTKAGAFLSLSYTFLGSNTQDLLAAKMKFVQPAPAPASSPVSAPAPLHVMDTPAFQQAAADVDDFNEYILKAVTLLQANYSGLGYGSAAFTHDLPFGKGEVLAASRKVPLTMCVAAQLEVITTALDLYWRDTGDDTPYRYLPKRSWESLRPIDLRGQIWIVSGVPGNGTADALVNFGMGKTVAFDSLKPGSFVNLNRTNGSGHAVTFLAYLDNKGNELQAYSSAVAGFKYFSSQGKGSGSGLGYRYAFFADAGCPTLDGSKKRDCGVIRSSAQKMLNTGVMLPPAAWNASKRPGRAFIEDADIPEGTFDASYFTGETTDN